MKKTLPLIALCLAFCLLPFALAGCDGAQKSAQSANGQDAVAQEEHEIPREEVEDLVSQALATDFTAVGFTMETRTTATATVEGQKQSQAMRTLSKGELSLDKDDPWTHMSYEAESNTQIGRQKYDMYVNSENMVIVQGEDMFGNPATKEDAANYSESLVRVTSEEEIKQILDVARSYKLETTEDGVKTVTITVDVDKIEEVGLVDTSTLPEGSSVATLVVNYTFDADNHFKDVRLMSSTQGTPTYRVTQSYSFYDYDQVQKPEWPDYEAYVLDKSGIKKDADGRLYMEADDGTAYYIESIDEDGTIHFIMPSTSTQTQTAEPIYTYTTGTTEENTSQQTQQTQQSQQTQQTQQSQQTQQTQQQTQTNNNTSTNTSNNNTSNQGRAYITDYNGVIHYLDEPGSEIVDLGSGVKALRTPEGGFFILNYGDEEG